MPRKKPPSAPPLPTLPPPPRRVRLRAGRWPFGCLQLFLVPHTLVGLGALGALLLHLYEPIVLLAGTDVPATVSYRHTGKSKKTTTYHVNCTYEFDGRQNTLTRAVPVEVYEQLKDGDAVAVRLITQTPTWFPTLVLPGLDPWWDWFRSMGFLLFFVLFWNGVMSVFWYFAYIRPLLYRWLVVHGLPCPGTITARRNNGPKAHNPYEVVYRYHLPVVEDGREAERTLESSMGVPEADFNAAEEGRTVTVLYSPRSPGFSILADFADYEPEPVRSGPILP